MSGENQSTATDSPAVEDEHDDADFTAGFSGQDDAPTETPAPAPAAEPAEAAAPAPEPAPEYVQVTRQDWERINASAAKVEEIEATVGKMPDHIFGTMGRTLERRLAEIQRETPQGEAVQVDEADFEDLKKEYPEMAELTLKGLNRALGKLKGSGAPDVQAIEKVVGQQVTAVRGEIIEASLEAVFPGWKDEVKTPQFDTWLKGQAADVQALAQSTKVGDAAKMLRLYEKSKEAPAAAPTPSPAPAPTPQAPAPSARQRQIAAAVVPRGDGGNPPARAEEDEFNAGFKYREGSG